LADGLRIVQKAGQADVYVGMSVDSLEWDAPRIVLMMGPFESALLLPSEGLSHPARG
jgi:hypothetical protein